MAKYSYHHQHPRLQETSHLYPGGTNTTWHFYKHRQAPAASTFKYNKMTSMCCWMHKITI